MRDIKLNQEEKQELLNFIDEYSQNISEDDYDEINKKLKRKIKVIDKNEKTPDYVNKMLNQIEEMAPLIGNKDVSEIKSNRIVAALHYFIWAEDKIADYIPVLGYIDDAYVISTVYQEVKKNIYRYTCENKKNK